MNVPAISDAEWEVMNVIWERHPVTASEIVTALASRTSWSPRTIKSMLNRLLRKGVLAHEVEGKRYLYRPLVSRERCATEASESFLERVFGGSAAPMIAHLVRNAKLSEDEIAKLRAVLEAAEKPVGKRRER
jgi:BlaI family penicillinase repressor